MSSSRQFDSARRRRRAVKRLERRLWKQFKATPTMLHDWRSGTGEVEFLRLDDKVTVSRDTSLKVHWLARGGHIDARTLTDDESEVPHDTIGFHLVEDADKVRRKGLKWFSGRVLERAPRSLGHEIDLRVKALLVTRYGEEEAARGLWEGTPSQFAFFGKIRLKEYMEVDADIWHLEGRLDFGGVLL